MNIQMQKAQSKHINIWWMSWILTVLKQFNAEGNKTKLYFCE